MKAGSYFKKWVHNELHIETPFQIWKIKRTTTAKPAHLAAHVRIAYIREISNTLE